MGQSASSSLASEAPIKVVHIAARISRVDGISASVLGICGALHESGVDVTLASVAGALQLSLPDFSKTFAPDPIVGSVASSSALREWLLALLRACPSAIIHSHGLWRMPNVYVGSAARRTSSLLLVSPHGALAQCALAKSRYQKKVFSAVFQTKALRQTTCFHATSEAERQDIRRAGFTQPVCVLRHGVAIPDLEACPSRSRRRLLFLGRVHVLKGVDILLHAWKRLEPRYPSWDLEIVGSGDPAEVRRLVALAAGLGVRRARFRGPLHGRDKLIALQEASLFVLPSPSENFGLAIAESLAAGTPVIVTKGTPWREVEARAAGWWIDYGLDSLDSTLNIAMSKSPEELEAMGSAGRAWMAVDFSWEDVGRQWLQTYQWLARPDMVPRPSWVRLD